VDITCGGFEALPVVFLQELCLGVIPTFAGLVEYTSLKNTIIPRITKLCLSATLLSVSYASTAEMLVL